MVTLIYILKFYVSIWSSDVLSSSLNFHRAFFLGWIHSNCCIMLICLSTSWFIFTACSWTLRLPWNHYFRKITTMHSHISCSPVGNLTKELCIYAPAIFPCVWYVCQLCCWCWRSLWKLYMFSWGMPTQTDKSIIILDLCFCQINAYNWIHSNQFLSWIVDFSAVS